MALYVVDNKAHNATNMLQEDSLSAFGNDLFVDKYFRYEGMPNGGVTEDLIKN
jgi:hypothetical protein